LNYHLRSNSGSNGPIAKECHRFLVAGPFKLPFERCRRASMIRFCSSLILFCAFVGAPLLAADRTLLAEGEYVQHTKDGTAPYDHWRLWQESDFTFSAEVESAKLPAFVQTFYFDSKFLPSGYSLTLTGPKEGDKIGMTCHQKNDTLACETSFEGKTSSTSTKVSGPCLVMVDEAPALDFVWAFAAMLRMPQRVLRTRFAVMSLRKRGGERSL